MSTPLLALIVVILLLVVGAGDAVLFEVPRLRHVLSLVALLGPVRVLLAELGDLLAQLVVLRGRGQLPA